MELPGTANTRETASITAEKRRRRMGKQNRSYKEFIYGHKGIRVVVL